MSFDRKSGIPRLVDICNYFSISLAYAPCITYAGSSEDNDVLALLQQSDSVIDGIVLRQLGPFGKLATNEQV